jgi:predicted TIM-barrel fold metal-dependent hydrolase
VIVDVHGHVGPWFFSTQAAEPADNLRLMDAYGIDIQLVSSVEAVVYDPLTGNRALVEQIQRHPRLKGLFVIDPRELDTAERELTQLLPTGVFVGGKIHTQYAHSPGGSSQMREALQLFAAHRLPVLVHTWGREIVDLAENVAEVETVAVVAAHMGGPDWRLVPEAAACSARLWFEPCYSHAPAGRIRWVVDRIGADRVLFGTDSTLIDPAVTMGAVQAAHLSEEETALVMGHNAMRIFDLGR